jgi:cytidine deaminase
VAADSLIAAARVAQANAHAPYSRYQVGAALESHDGRVYAGANVESASFGVTICAERVALGAAVTHGVREFRRIVVVTHSEPPAAPCGACRQALAEFGLDLAVESVGPRSVRRWSLRELLPDAFLGADLHGGIQ